MLKFLLGVFVGAILGIFMMCMCIISGDCARNEDRRTWINE